MQPNSELVREFYHAIDIPFLNGLLCHHRIRSQHTSDCWGKSIKRLLMLLPEQ